MVASGSGLDTETGVKPVAGGGEWLLFTPARAAEVLAVRESWLRRKAGRREVPCTFVGKHLRFSVEDLRAIVAGGSRPARSWSAGPVEVVAVDGSCCGGVVVLCVPWWR